MPAVAALVAAGLWAVPAAASPATLPVAAADLTPSVETLPTVQIDKGVSGRDGAVVWSQALVGNTVYAGGDFTVARPAGAKRGTNEIPRTHLLAYDIRTGKLLPFNHTLDGQVRGVAASPDGKRVYITGDFSKVDGQTRTRVAAFNTADGSLVADFRPVLGAGGLAIAASNSAVYVGGNFTKVGKVAGGTLVPRQRLAAFSPVDGAVLDFRADVDNSVTALAVTKAGDRVVAGGRFWKLASGQVVGSGGGLASFDPTTGAMQSFPMNKHVFARFDSGTGFTSLYADETGIYGSAFNYAGTFNNLEGTFRADPKTGEMLWIADCYGDTYAITQAGGVVWDTSHHHDCANIPGGFPEFPGRLYYAGAYTIEAAGTNGPQHNHHWSHEGKPAPRMYQWFPEFLPGRYTVSTQAAWSIVGNDQYVSFGGEFQAVNNKKIQQGLVRFLVPGGGGEVNPVIDDRDDAGAGAGAEVAPGGAVGKDTFARQAASGWGNAGQGGAWKPDTKPAYFSADGNRGLITIPTAGWTSQARLADLDQADVDLNVQVGVTKRPTTGMTRVWASARTSADFKSAYLLRANVNPTGQVESLQVIKRVAGAETVISTASNLGLTLGVNDLAQLRLRVVGTTIQGKVWKAGTTEPASWQIQVTDSSVKTTGSVGLGAYTGASATPLPVTVVFDNLTVTKAG